MRLLKLGLILIFFTACEFQADKNPTVNRKALEPEQGRQLVVAYGCVSCHKIPGTYHQAKWVGPPLDKWKQRKILAGKFPNTMKNLVRWIRFPSQMQPGTAMPDLHISKKDAEDMAIYLFSLD